MKPHLPPSLRGFTLIEMMAVILVVTILIALSLPALSSLMEGNNLARAGQTLSDQINLARQIASARNSAVEIRFVKNDPAITNGFAALQLWLLDTSGNYKAVTKPTYLPKGTIISENSSFSSVFNATNNLSATNSIPANSGALSNLKYAAVQIRPSGVMIPKMDMKDAGLTLITSRYASGSTLPNNYVTIQINPLTSTPLVYRP